MAGQRPITAALYNIFYGEEFIEASLESVYEHVDRIYLFLSQRAIAPGSDQRPDDIGACIDRFIADCDWAGKVRLIERDFTELPTAMDNETAKYNWALQTILAQGPVEFIVNIDADEVLEHGVLGRMLEICRGYQGPARQFLVPFQVYFGYVNHVIDPPVETHFPQEMCPLICRPAPDSRYVYGRQMDPELQVMVPTFPRLHHFSYVRKDDAAMRMKLAAFGHHAEVGGRWFEDKYLAWRRDTSLTHLHPVIPEGYRAAKPIGYHQLPYAVRRTLGRLKRLCPAMFKPEGD